MKMRVQNQGENGAIALILSVSKFHKCWRREAGEDFFKVFYDLLMCFDIYCQKAIVVLSLTQAKEPPTEERG
ncbi:MAG TPA: hypothetical protein V6D14_27610 [Coleofasciculaceae cyanobacterium]